MSKITTGFKVVWHDKRSAFICNPDVAVNYHIDKWTWPQIKGSKLFAFTTLHFAAQYIRLSAGVYIYTCDLLDEREQPEAVLWATYNLASADVLGYWNTGLGRVAPAQSGGTIARAIKIKELV